MRPDFISMLKPKVKGIVIGQQLPVNAHNRQTTVLHYLREKEFRSLVAECLHLLHLVYVYSLTLKTVGDCHITPAAQDTTSLSNWLILLPSGSLALFLSLSDSLCQSFCLVTFFSPSFLECQALIVLVALSESLLNWTQTNSQHL